MEMATQTLLQDSGMVGVRGDSCSGKTGVLYGVMQIFGETNKDWNIIRITNEEHLRACYEKQNVLLVIDDILDQNVYMLKHLDTLNNYIDKGYWKVIFSYSNESYKTIECKPREYNVLDGGHVLNISVSYECTNDEKIGILNSNCMHIGYTLPEETSKQCVESVPTKYFFYYVRNYVNTEECRGECAPIDFFQNPIEDMVRDLKNLKASNLSGFYILFCCSVLGCDLDISTQYQKQFNKHAKKISKWLLASNNSSDQRRSLERMQCAGRDIPTKFIEHIGSHKYRIKLDCVARGVQLIILSELNILVLSDTDKLFKHALFLCNFSVIRTFLRSDDVASPLKLQIHEDNFGYVAKRFIDEIQSGHVQRVGKHPLFSNDAFKRTFQRKLSRYDEHVIWHIFSKLDKQTDKALIVFAVEHDKPDHATNLTNIILESKLWRKYSRKEGTKVQRQLLVLEQNALALKRAVRYTNDKSTPTLTALIGSVFRNAPMISKWKLSLKEAALRIVTEAHATVVYESSDATNEVMELFRKIEADTHLGDFKQSLLHLCVICRNEYILERVLELRKVDINCQNYLGQTPLHTAVQKDNLEAVRILIKAGAVIEIRDQYGNTAIHLAVHENTHILKELICVNGVDVNVRNNAGKTPYQLARELDKTEHMKTLEMADVNDQ